MSTIGLAHFADSYAETKNNYLLTPNVSAEACSVFEVCFLRATTELQMWLTVVWHTVIYIKTTKWHHSHLETVSKHSWVSKQQTSQVGGEYLYTWR